jgi:type IV secretory pathway ATPase VirB11/archaellum biosynthesis ATPase
MSDDNSDNGTHQPSSAPRQRYLSTAGLREKIEGLFFAETEGRPDLWSSAAPDERRELLRDIFDYVLSTETISLTRHERTQILDEAYRDLFDFGPLRPLFDDPTVTEIAVRSPLDVYARHGFEELGRLDVAFDDSAHLERVLQGVVIPAGYDLSRDPFIETGIVIADRRVRLTSVAPPLMPSPQVALRLHPPQPYTLARLIATGFIEERFATILQRHITSRRGVMIAGEVATGKTTLLSALVQELPAADLVVVERAAELTLAAASTRLAATAERPFAQQITAALDRQPAWFVLDELRFDESAAMWAAITAEAKPTLLWAVRGSSDPLRLRTAFSMAVRRAQAGIAQEFINSGLLDRLPLVALLGHKKGKAQPQVLQLGKWERGSDSDDAAPLELRLLSP